MSLVNEIIEGNKAEEKKKCDELGLGYSDYYIEHGEWESEDVFAQYLVARALFIVSHPEDGKYNPYTRFQPHVRDGELFNGNQWLAETMDNLYKLSHYVGKVNRPVMLAFYRHLKEHVPRLNMDYIQIDEYSFWDKKAGEMVTIADIEERIKEGVL